MEFTIVEAVAAGSSSTGNSAQRDSLSTAIQNALIVEEISKYISISDMINCRSANNFWKTEWTLVIQKRSDFLLCLTDKIDMLVKQLQVSVKNSPNLRFDERTRNKFLRLGDSKIIAIASLLIQWVSEDIHNFPCSKIRVGTRAFKSVDQNLQENFFRAISNIVTELQLEDTHDDPAFHLAGTENLNLMFCKLRVLKIDLCFVNHGGRDFIKFYQNVIQLATNLHTLSLMNQLKYDYRYVGGGDFGFLAACVSAISDPKHLKTLHIKGTVTDNLVGKLIEKNLNLTEFLVRFENIASISSKTFQRFLISQSTSLKQLYLKCMGFGLQKVAIAIIFPRMTKLEFLEIEGFSGLRFPDLNLQQSFPKLKHLRMSDVGEGITSDFNQSLQALQTLEEFYLRRSGRLQNDVLQICRLFPNLKRLSVPCEKFVLPAMNSGMMNSLEELTLFSEHWQMLIDMNGALTGFTGVQLIVEDQRGTLVGMDSGPMEFLHKVKILRLVNGFLSDRLCIAGPMRLQSLQCLDLLISDPYKKHKISEEMLRRMREKFTVLLED